MRQAVQIAEESLEATLPTIRAGVSEMEVAAQLEYEMRRRGSEGTPLEPLWHQVTEERFPTAEQA